jgi:ABC-2 type transport system ATP-binding protein
MLAEADRRADAIVPMITWNDLANAFLPESTGAGPAQGVFKKQWAGLFFGRAGSTSILDAAGVAGSSGVDGGSGGSGGDETPPQALPDVGARFDPACGRFARDVCAAYLDVATTGRASQATIDLLHRSSPAPTLSQITAPTLLIQGQADSLFPLNEGEANYRGIAATGTRVRVDWFTGGHDGGQGPQADQDRLRYLTITWLDFYLKHEGDDPGTGFTFSRVSGFDPDTRRITTTGFKSSALPDAPGGEPAIDITLAGSARPIANPPDGNPAAISTLPGTGTACSRAYCGVALEVPGQHADFYPSRWPATPWSAPDGSDPGGTPSGEAVLFLKLTT